MSRLPLSALLVDDDEDFRSSLAMLVARDGFAVREAGSLAEARARLEEAPADLVLADLRLPDGEGLDLLRDADPERVGELILITGNASVESAVSALRQGVLDYFTKPVDRVRLKSILANVARTRSLKEEVRSLRTELRELGRFGAMVGRSPVMQRVYDLVERVAPTEAGVMISGESGTGKELVAETIHRLSRRRERPFVAVNAGALAPGIVESELFGHERGAFTGAERTRRGLFEGADGGTLFLDEVTEMPAELQVKLLRALESGSLQRVGSSETIAVDVRVLAATNRDPEQAVKQGLLREDLFYRLNVFPIAMPPLRERGDDIELLAGHFLAAVNEREATEKHWSPAALRRLRALTWPGNVRELKNLVERAAIMADDVIGEDLVPCAAGAVSPAGEEIRVRVGTPLADSERRLILATLAQTGGDKRRAAEILGISVKTIYNRLSVYEAAATPAGREGDR